MITLSSTARRLVFILTCSFMCSTSVFSTLSQFYLRGVYLWRGTGILLYSFFTPRSVIFILSNSISAVSLVCTVSNFMSSLLSASSSSMPSSTPAKAASVVFEIFACPSFLVSSWSLAVVLAEFYQKRLMEICTYHVFISVYLLCVRY